MNHVYPEFVRHTGDKRPDFNTRWDIVRCSSARGCPTTNIADQKMAVPLDPDETARTIRAHELMHVRISPPDIRPWLKRGKATLESLLVAEETRVNYLLEENGFDPVSHLIDERDYSGAYQAAKRKDLPTLIRAVVATWSTAGLRQTLRGIEDAVNEGAAEPQTLEACRAIIDKIQDIYAEHGRMASSDRPIRGSKTMTRGFLLTEAIAALIDRYNDIAQTTGKIPKFRKGGEELEDIHHKFAELVPGKTDLTRFHNGNMGKVKLACDTGRNPRRIHRMLTDPHRRVFDRLKRDKGAIVLIDWSGSMEMEASQILQILNAAPGATVAAYCHKTGSTDVPNFWVLAKDGKMVSDLPRKYGKGNGVDGTALRWALKNRRLTNEPIVWVCDGCVTSGQNDSAYAHLNAECRALAIKGKVVMKECVEHALEYLKQLTRGCAIPGPKLIGNVATG